MMIPETDSKIVYKNLLLNDHLRFFASQAEKSYSHSYSLRLHRRNVLPWQEGGLHYFRKRD